jgi:cell division protein FtsN
MHRMHNPNRSTYRSEAGVALRSFLNTIGFFALLVVCFFIGFLVIGPRVRQAPAAARSTQSNLDKDTNWGQAPERPRVAAHPKPARAPAAEVKVTEGTPKPDETSTVRDANTLEQLSHSTDTNPTQPPAPAVETPPAPQPKTQKYYVQTGVFADRKHADTVVSDLANAGYGASVRQVTRGDATLYQVIVGNPKSRPEAQRFLNELRSAGRQAFLTPAD